MALIEQNADMIKQAMFEELLKILNPNGEIRKSAEERLSQLKYTEGYGLYLAEITVTQSLELALRQLASVMLKQYVEECWCLEEEDSVTTLVATPAAKKAIKNILPEGLYDPNSKIRSVVAYSISNIASYDWPNDWQELFDIIVKCLSGNENSVHGAMKVLVEFTHDLDKQIEDVGPMILSEVYRIFEAELVYSVTTRSYAVEILTSLLRSINTQVESKQAQASLLNPILPSFMQKMIEGLTVPNGAHSSFLLKTQIVKVLNYMIIEMPKFVKQYFRLILPPIWQLLTQMADIYIKVIVNETSESPFTTDSEGDENVEFNQMVLQIFEFLHSIIEFTKFKGLITNVLPDLVYIIIIYMQMTEEQVQIWSDDPEKFVEDEDEQGVDFSIRTSAHDVLLIIGQEYDQTFLISLSDALSKHIAVADANRNAGEMHWWKIHEASMLAVGSFKDMIFDNDGKFATAQYLNLVKSIMDYQVSPYLLGRCLWILSRYAECNIYDEQSLQQVIEMTINSVSVDKPIVLRITAARAIYGFCTNLKECTDDRHSFLTSKLEIFLDSLMPLFSQSQNTVLGLLLETLTSIISFDLKVTSTMSNKVMSLTIAIFLKYHDDRFILELVQDLLKILSQNPYCLGPLQEKIIPTLVSILNMDGEQTTMQDIALDILQTVVKYSLGSLSDNMIENAFPAAVHCILRTEDHSVMQSGGECLRAFLAVAPEQVCSYKNGEGLNYIMQVTTMLLNPMNMESTAAFIGRLVITIMTKVGNLLGEKVDLLLKAVISKMQLVESLNVIMSLVMIFAHLILVQMDAVLNFLSTVPGPTGEPAMTFVFAIWLSRQHLFFGVYERKVSTMALCKLFEYGVTTKDERLNSVMIKEPIACNNESKMRTRSATAKCQQEWADIPILLKIFKLLLNELSNLKEAKEAVELDDMDDTDNSSDGEPKATNFSALMLFAEDEDDEDDQQLMQELLKNPIFQCDTQEYLVKFFQSFSCDEHYRVFLDQMNDTEKAILRGFDINVA